MNAKSPTAIVKIAHLTHRQKSVYLCAVVCIISNTFDAVYEAFIFAASRPSFVFNSCFDHVY